MNSNEERNVHLPLQNVEGCSSVVSNMGYSKFDELLTRLGTGKWNVIYFVTCTIWFSLIPAQTFNVVYLAPQLNHTCRPPQTEDVIVSEDSCTYFVNTSKVLQEESCFDWDFDDSIYYSTLTSEFGLVCSKAYLRATYQSIYMFSTIFSSLIIGYLADRYGRKIVIVVSQALYSITCIGISFLTNFNVILAFRFVLGALATPTIYMLTMEVCESSKRSVVGIMLGLPWALGTIAWGAIAYFVRDWRWLQGAVSFPTLLVFPLLYLIDESPRWLIVRGHHKRALKVLQRAARLNNASLPPTDELLLMMKDMQETQTSETVNKSKTLVMDSPQEQKSRWSFTTPKVLSTPKMRLVVAMLCVNLFIASLVYSGLTLSGTSYSDDPFLYIIISGLMEVPAYTLTVPIVSRWGRKFPTIIGYFITGAAVTSLVFIPRDISWLVMTLAMLGKLALSSSFMIIFVYEAELLPTEVRLQGLAMTIVVGQVAATISPYIADYLSPIVPWLPSTLFGLSSIVAGLSLMPLPETLNANLPDTVSDLEDLWKKKSVADVGDKSELEGLNA